MSSGRLRLGGVGETSASLVRSALGQKPGGHRFGRNVGFGGKTLRRWEAGGIPYEGSAVEAGTTGS